MKKFKKSYLKRVEQFMLDGTNKKEYIYHRIFELKEYEFEIDNNDRATFIEVFKNKECIALIHFGKFKLLDDFELLEIANNIIDTPIERLSFQNGVSKENGYLKISNNYFLTDCDPT